ncbi:neurogenic protein big brain-like [Macrosteles quadrilineatus]|uniref:neurogenic protein big brain-like n=1 Tax=Macrosteles quadrilineatus TaxID=74068 RepID=UPI0023E2E5F8|nr:neurogenic protein big brain-like [Macrosteles quadrilineatus]XP_054290950.1 neurogenic protein big brain-like [Macrosteles quadrilineatus]
MTTPVVQDVQSVEYGVATLLEKIATMRRDDAPPRLLPAKAEMRTLEFWRSIISECLASFFYVFVVCGASAAVAPTGSQGLVVIANALAAGFSMAALTQAFGHVSGAQVNPAVSVAMAVTRNISYLRAVLFITAQGGGSIAGAALLYGVTLPGRNMFPGDEKRMPATLAQVLVATQTPWQKFGIEVVLSFVIVYTYFVTMDSQRRWLTGPGLSIGAAYLACSLVATSSSPAYSPSNPALNPARALGPAFVMNKWDYHWVFWFGPILGGIAAGLIYEYIFNPRRHGNQSKESIDGDSSSIHSDEDTYDELDKPRSTYNTLRSVQPGAALYGPVTSASPNGAPGYCASLYSAPPCKLDRVESLYGGTKSLYAKSPPLTRANLNRSQSVYTKSSGPIVHREGIVPRPGPLVPAQSLYPMRLNSTTSNTNAANQNQQNQQRLGGESVYGVRSINNGTGGIYGKIPGRPESVYGTRRQDSADSSYGSYQSNQGNQQNRGNYAQNIKQASNFQQGNVRQSPQQNVGIPVAGPPPPYLQQHPRNSPNPQY